MADKVSIYDENGELAEGVERIRTQCYFCHANCGVLAYVKDGDVIKIEGDPDYNNQGGLCCRGTSALLHVNHPARINHALKRAGEKGENKWEQIPYDQAIKEVAERLNQIKAESGAEAVASAGGTTRTDDWARRRFLNQFGTPGFPQCTSVLDPDVYGRDGRRRLVSVRDRPGRCEVPDPLGHEPGCVFAALHARLY